MSPLQTSSQSSSKTSQSFADYKKIRAKKREEYFANEEEKREYEKLITIRNIF